MCKKICWKVINVVGLRWKSGFGHWVKMIIETLDFEISNLRWWFVKNNCGVCLKRYKIDNKSVRFVLIYYELSALYMNLFIYLFVYLAKVYNCGILKLTKYNEMTKFIHAINTN